MVNVPLPKIQHPQQFYPQRVPPAARSVSEMEVSLEIDANGILKVSPVEKGTGHQSCQPSLSLTKPPPPPAIAYGLDKTNSHSGMQFNKVSQSDTPSKPPKAPYASPVSSPLPTASLDQPDLKRVRRVTDFVVDAADQVVKWSKLDLTWDDERTLVKDPQDVMTSSNSCSTPTGNPTSSQCPASKNLDVSYVNAFYVTDKYHDILYKHEFAVAALLLDMAGGSGAPVILATHESLISLPLLTDTMKLVILGGPVETARCVSASAWNSFVDSFFLSAHFSQEDYPFDWRIRWLSKPPA
ncbi:hypothetical protein FRC05_005941 [Tulasnella sp. 425]|nr:hypothetical protein FRC05_005941 [Tulasnella sp. 425]